MCKKVGSEPSTAYLPQLSANVPERAPAEAVGGARAPAPFCAQDGIGFGAIQLSLSFVFGLGSLPRCGSIPAPSPDQCSAPAGKGLTKNADGSITTAGGYRIVAEGKQAAWSIYGPDGKKLTRVWGDPHVSEKDGTKWDFTKSSNFVLPDGTRIRANTGGGKGGQTVTTSLDIANGSDRVKIDGIRSNKPVTGELTSDGLAGWKADNDGRETYELHHDDRRQNWVKHRANGQLEGVVTGAYQKTPMGAYLQRTTGRDSQLPGGAPADAATPNAAAATGTGAPGATNLDSIFGSPERLFAAFEALRALLFGRIGDRAQLSTALTPDLLRP